MPHPAIRRDDIIYTPPGFLIALISLLEIAFENNNRRGRVDFAFVKRPIAALFKQTGTGFHGAKTFVMELYFNTETTMNTVGKFTRSGSQWLLGTVHIQRQTDDDFVRLPLFQ